MGGDEPGDGGIAPPMSPTCPHVGNGRGMRGLGREAWRVEMNWAMGASPLRWAANLAPYSSSPFFVSGASKAPGSGGFALVGLAEVGGGVTEGAGGG